MSGAETRLQRRQIVKHCQPSQSRARLRRPTGRPEWFEQMERKIRDKKHETWRRKILRKLPVSKLYDEKICTGSQAIALASDGYQTIWDVVDASYKDLLDVPGFGPKTLAKLKQDAMIKGNLKMNWSVPDGR